MNKRITATYKNGHGDRGLSPLMNGQIVRKDDPSCLIYSEIEHLNNLITEVLNTFDIKYNKLFEQLNWLKVNSFSISSFCFMKGDSTKHNLSIEFNDELESLVNELKLDKQIGEASDFIIHNKIKYIKLDAIRIRIRDVERAFTTWRNHELVVNNLMELLVDDPIHAQQVIIAINAYGGFLNRLSTFIWLTTRMESLLSGDYDSQEYWQGQIVK